MLLMNWTAIYNTLVFFLGFWKHKCFQVHPQNITLETAAVSFLSHDGVSVDGGGFWAVYDEYK